MDTVHEMHLHCFLFQILCFSVVFPKNWVIILFGAIKFDAVSVELLYSDAEYFSVVMRMHVVILELQMCNIICVP